MPIEKHARVPSSHLIAEELEGLEEACATSSDALDASGARSLLLKSQLLLDGHSKLPHNFRSGITEEHDGAGRPGIAPKISNGGADGNATGEESIENLLDNFRYETAEAPPVNQLYSSPSFTSYAEKN